MICNTCDSHAAESSLPVGLFSGLVDGMDSDSTSHDDSRAYRADGLGEEAEGAECSGENECFGHVKKCNGTENE